MTFIVRIPANRTAEREYVWRTILETFLAQHVHVVREDRTDTQLTLEGDPDRKIVFDDHLFATPDADWLTKRSVPNGRREPWQLPRALRSGVRHGDLVLLFGQQSDSGEYATVEDNLVHFRHDIPGTVFFMLSRYEEAANPARDELGRFSAKDSVLTTFGVLHRPVADECVEILWASMRHLWPRVPRKRSSFKVSPTHDVDRPFCTYKRPFRQIGRQLSGDVLRRHDLGLASRRALSAVRVRFEGERADICNTFDWIMGQSEERGLRSAFYFLPATGNSMDSAFGFSDPAVQRLLSTIHNRRHEVGLHPSYESYKSRRVIAKEFKSLQLAAKTAGFDQEEWGGRQHYLRWEAGLTWRNWEAAGLSYDSTAGFADRAGFRCGTSREFPVFDLFTRRQLALVERPLIVMEETLLASEYEGLAKEEALATIRRLAAECRHYEGNFVLLWHNSRLVSSEDRDTYSAALDAAWL